MALKKGGAINKAENQTKEASQTAKPKTGKSATYTSSTESTEEIKARLQQMSWLLKRERQQMRSRA